jgi:hypothetical protein
MGRHPSTEIEINKSRIDKNCSDIGKGGLRAVTYTALVL